MDDDSSTEGVSRRHRSCGRVADSMGAALEQGAADRAVTLFDPDLMLQVSAQSKMHSRKANTLADPWSSATLLSAL